MFLFVSFFLWLFWDFLYLHVEKTEKGLWRFYTQGSEELEGLRTLLELISLGVLLIFLILGFRTRFSQERMAKEMISSKDIHYLCTWAFFLLFSIYFIPSPDFGQFVFFVGIFLIGYWMFSDQPNIIGLRRPNHLNKLILRIPRYYVLLMIIQFLIASLLERVFWVDLYSEREEGISSGLSSNEFLTFLYVCIGAPLGEEMLFRGYIQTYFRRFGKWIGIFLTAVLFSLYHVDVSSFFQILVIGLFLGWLKERYQSLWASILLHFVNNVVATISDLFS